MDTPTPLGDKVVAWVIGIIFAFVVGIVIAEQWCGCLLIGGGA